MPQHRIVFRRRESLSPWNDRNLDDSAADADLPHGSVHLPGPTLLLESVARLLDFPGLRHGEFLLFASESLFAGLVKRSTLLFALLRHPASLVERLEALLRGTFVVTLGFKAG